MEAIVFSKTGQKEEAYHCFEELLFADYQRIQLIETEEINSFKFSTVNFFIVDSPL